MAPLVAAYQTDPGRTASGRDWTRLLPVAVLALLLCALGLRLFRKRARRNGG